MISFSICELQVKAKDVENDKPMFVTLSTEMNELQKAGKALNVWSDGAPSLNVVSEADRWMPCANFSSNVPECLRWFADAKLPLFCSCIHDLSAHE